MNQQEILNIIESICKSTFDNDRLVITASSSANDIEEWDSMTNLILIDNIEKEFAVKFSFDEILRAQNIGDLCSFIEKKISLR